MESFEQLIADAFWLASDVAVMHEGEEAERLADWASRQDRLRAHVCFRTSGSTQSPKYVCLSREALRHSAEMVNTHLEVTPNDRWLAALPHHHVGGFGIAARAYFQGIPCHVLDGAWDPISFAKLARDEHATLTSLVPTQIHDLVASDCPAPPSLRAVLVGGGALGNLLEEKARALGWPLLKTYGMTETASQVATQPLNSLAADPLQVLPGWNVSTNSKDHLSLRGEALFTGYVRFNPEGFQLDDAFREAGWFATSDRVRLQASPLGGTQLHFLGRSTQRLKIKGELVHLAPLRQQLEDLAIQLGLDAKAVTVIAQPHPRDEECLVLVLEKGRIPLNAATRLGKDFDAQQPSISKLSGIFELDQLPRTDLGKLDELALRQKVDALTERDSLS